MKKEESQGIKKDNLQSLATTRTEIDEASVSDYLLNHPEFLDSNPDLFSRLNIQHQTTDSTSLVERQVKVLREKNQKIQSQLIDMLWAADANEKLLVKCNEFMLAMLQQEDLDDFATQLRSHLKTQFELDDAALILVGNFPHSTQIKNITHSGWLREQLGTHFPCEQPVCGRLTKEAKFALFGDFGKDLESFALIPLAKNCESGLLALASKDPLRFKPELGTLFIELIANLVVHLIKQFQDADQS